MLLSRIQKKCEIVKTAAVTYLILKRRARCHQRWKCSSSKCNLGGLKWLAFLLRVRLLVHNRVLARVALPDAPLISRAKEMVMRLPSIAIGCACLLGTPVTAPAADVQSISRLAAGPDDVLFVADWRTARVHAIALPAAPHRASEPFN